MTCGGYVYLMASGRNGTLYLGSTTDLAKRAWQHRHGVMEGFTKEHGCTLLVWYEAHDTWWGARERERRMKGWRRGWKIARIEADNPCWQDLSGTLV